MSCPICHKPSAAAFRPFCSGRCADIDLAKWFDGSYAVPSTDPDDAEAAEQAAEEALNGSSEDPLRKPH
ncbi:DNA gyrase inhibitor YacG [Rhodobacteraceae bacterium KMM 6894]|nr:DNA gyrase inhibitor YacG [Rhodobacteraceae bacterium KMM 6894]